MASQTGSPRLESSLPWEPQTLKFNMVNLQWHADHPDFNKLSKLLPPILKSAVVLGKRTHRPLIGFRRR
jgi:hypothetical protein